MTPKRIYKYDINIGSGTVHLPSQAEILSVGVQYGQLVCWALVQPSDRLEERRLIIEGTGREAPSLRGRFLGTHLLEGGALVLHVWEEPQS